MWLSAFIAGESLLLFLAQLPSFRVWCWILLCAILGLVLILFLRNKRLKIYHRSISDAFWNLMAGAVLAFLLGFMCPSKFGEYTP